MVICKHFSKILKRNKIILLFSSIAILLKRPYLCPLFHLNSSKMRFIILTLAVLAIGCSKNTDNDAKPTPADPSTTLTGEHLKIFETLDGKHMTKTHDGALWYQAKLDGLTFTLDADANQTYETTINFQRIEEFWLNENNPRLNYVSGIDTLTIGVIEANNSINALLKHGSDVPKGYNFDL